MVQKVNIGYSYRGDVQSVIEAQAAPVAYQANVGYMAGGYQVGQAQLAPGISQGYYYGGAGVGGAATPPPLIADPAWSTEAQVGGILDRSEGIFSLFVNAKRGIQDLRDRLKVTPPDQEKALIARITDYAQDHVTNDELTQYFGPFDKAGVFTLPDLDPVIDPGTEIEVPGASPTAPKVKENDHSALFRTASLVSKDIRTTDALRYGLSMIRRARQRTLEAKQAALEALGAEIPPARATLAVLTRARNEALGDYAVAQRLVAEDWAAVERAFAQRRRILEGNLGLYYVRVRETPVGLTLPDPLDLRHAAADDLVPGCAIAALDLPEDLAPFLEAVLDVPVSDWAALRGLIQLMPGRERIEALVGRRRARLQLRLNSDGQGAGSRLAQRLAPLRTQTLGLTRELLARPFATAGALSQVQRQGSEVLSLEDLLSGPPHRLRDPARTLHQRLDAAAGCLHQRLRAIAPGIRLDWAAAAEDDRLDLERPALWPGLERAEAADFNGVRTLVELVQWWFRQLAPEPSGASRTALRNFLRAALLYAAGDDPDQILEGTLTSLPGRFLPGAVLRLNLNREAMPGTTLQLLDQAQRVVGTLRVDDHDGSGALASVVQVLDPGARLATGLRVSGVL